MKLTKLEHSGFILETDAGFKLALDIAVFTPIGDLANLSPVDAFLVSHIHPDHFSSAHIEALSPKKVYLNQECIDGLGETKPAYEVMRIQSNMSEDIAEGLKISCFEVDHGPNVTVKPKDNMGFLIELDDQLIYFAGDMFYESGIKTKELVVDYALLPIGGFYTFGVSEALAFAKTFKIIKTLVPMHYHNNPPAVQEFAKNSSVFNTKILDKPNNQI